MSESPQYVTCHCQHCDGGIEFDASDFEKEETRSVVCPHCRLETILFIPEQEKVPPPVLPAQTTTNASASPTSYIQFKCEICDQIIQAKNVNPGECITCPHCKSTQIVPRTNFDFIGEAGSQTGPDIAYAEQEDSNEALERLQEAAKQGNAAA